MPKYARYYTVEGVGAFPVDMLRYDCSHPERESDSNSIAMDAFSSRLEAYNSPREIRLIRTFDTAADARAFKPTHRRWHSFGGWMISREPESCPEWGEGV